MTSSAASRQAAIRAPARQRATSRSIPARPSSLCSRSACARGPCPPALAGCGACEHAQLGCAPAPSRLLSVGRRGRAARAGAARRGSELRAADGRRPVAAGQLGRVAGGGGGGDASSSRACHLQAASVRRRRRCRCGRLAGRAARGRRRESCGWRARRRLGRGCTGQGSSAGGGSRGGVRAAPVRRRLLRLPLRAVQVPQALLRLLRGRGRVRRRVRLRRLRQQRRRLRRGEPLSRHTAARPAQPPSAPAGRCGPKRLCAGADAFPAKPRSGVASRFWRRAPAAPSARAPPAAAAPAAAPAASAARASA